MKTAYIDLPLSLIYYSGQIAGFVLSQNYIPLNPFHMFGEGLAPDASKKEATRTLREIEDEVWSFRKPDHRFPKTSTRKFLVLKDHLTIEEII